MRPTLETFLAEHPKKYLIFDFDETLFTLQLPWGEYLDHVYDVLKEYNADFFASQAISNETNYQLINKFTREFGSEPRDTTVAYAKEFETGRLTGVTEKKTQTSFVRENKEQYHFFIWSSNCVDTFQPILEKNGLTDHFEKLIGRDTVTYCKPDPDGFTQIKQYVAEHIGANCQLSEFAMIGDSNSDEGAAYHAAIDFYRVE